MFILLQTGDTINYSWEFDQYVIIWEACVVRKVLRERRLLKSCWRRYIVAVVVVFRVWRHLFFT